MHNVPARGLPPQISVPITLVATAVVVAVVVSFVRIGLGVTGSALGPTAGQSPIPRLSAATTQGTGVGGGSAGVAVGAAPPAPVQRLLTEFKSRLARNPRDLAALVGLGDLYADAGKFPQAEAYYRRALAVDPRNEAAADGMQRVKNR